MKKIILLILNISLLVGCLPVGTAPSRYKYLHKSPDGPMNFQKGWRDGCDTATATQVSAFYKAFYRKFKKDYNNADPDYGTAWTMGFWFCHRYYETLYGYTGVL